MKKQAGPAPATRDEAEAGAQNRLTPDEVLRTAIAADAKAVLTDPRYTIVRNLTSRYEAYTHQLEWMATNLRDAVCKNREQGIPGVYASIGSSSLWQDVPRLAAQIEELRDVLRSMVRKVDDPNAAPLDAVIHRILPE